MKEDSRSSGQADSLQFFRHSLIGAIRVRIKLIAISKLSETFSIHRLLTENNHNDKRHHTG